MNLLTMWTAWSLLLTGSPPAAEEETPAVLVVMADGGADDVRARPDLAVYVAERLRERLAEAGFEVPTRWSADRPVSPDGAGFEPGLSPSELARGFEVGAVGPWTACERTGADHLVEAQVIVEEERAPQTRRRVRSRLRLRLSDPDGGLRWSDEAVARDSSLVEGFAQLHRQALDRVLLPGTPLLAALIQTLERERQRAIEQGPLYRLQIELDEATAATWGDEVLPRIEGVVEGSIELLESAGTQRMFALRFPAGRARLEAALQRAATEAALAERAQQPGHAGEDPALDRGPVLRFLSRGRHVRVLRVPPPRPEAPAAEDPSSPEPSPESPEDLAQQLGERASEIAREMYDDDPSLFEGGATRFTPRPWVDQPASGADSGAGAPLLPERVGDLLGSVSQRVQSALLEASGGNLVTAPEQDVLGALLDQWVSWSESGSSRLPKSLRAAWRSDTVRRVLLSGLDDTPDGWMLRLSLVDLDQGWKHSVAEALGAALSTQVEAMLSEQ